MEDEKSSTPSSEAEDGTPPCSETDSCCTAERAHTADEVDLLLASGSETAEGEDWWEQAARSVCLISRTSPLLSSATVQWDVPLPSAETPPAMKDGDSTNEPDFENVTCPDTTSPLLHQPRSLDSECYKEEEDGLDSRLFRPDTEGAAGDISEPCCNFQPCDPADVKQLKTQEKDNRAHEQLDAEDEFLLGVCSEDNNQWSGTLDPPAKTEIEDSEDAVNSPDHLTPPKECEEVIVLLTGQEEAEGKEALLALKEIEKRDESLHRVDQETENQTDASGLVEAEEEFKKGKEVLIDLIEVEKGDEGLHREEQEEENQTDASILVKAEEESKEPGILLRPQGKFQEEEVSGDTLMTEEEKTSLREETVAEETQESGNSSDFYVLLTPEQEQDISVLLTGQEDAEEEETSSDVDETWEEHEDVLIEVENQEAGTDVDSYELLKSDEGEEEEDEEEEEEEESEEEEEQEEEDEDDDEEEEQEEEVDDCPTGQVEIEGDETLTDREKLQQGEETWSDSQAEENIADLLKIEQREEAESDICMGDEELILNPQQTDTPGKAVLAEELKDLLGMDIMKDTGHSGAGENGGFPNQTPDELLFQTEMAVKFDDIVQSEECKESQAVDRKEDRLEEQEEAERVEKLAFVEQHESSRTSHPQLTPSESGMVELSHESEGPVHPEAEMEFKDEFNESEKKQQLMESVCIITEDSGDSEQVDEKQQSEQNERSVLDDPADPSLQTHPGSESKIESGIQKELSAASDITKQTEGTVLRPVDTSEYLMGSDGEVIQMVKANGEHHHKRPGLARMNGNVDRDVARCLADRLYRLEGFQHADVVKHLDKDNDFSRAVGEEYLQFFDFSGQTLDQALRSFLKVVVLIGETQERERVLQHFAARYHQCNPQVYSSPQSVLALTCALMLLNTDLHGQNVGKSMSSSKFVSNLDGMNEGENFSKDLLKGLYNSIKNEPIEWAVDKEELKSSMMLDENNGDCAPLRSKANPFQDVPHDENASVVKEGFLQRKLHADIDGKRTPWGKRGWKTFYGVVRGMVLYLQKDTYRKDQHTNAEVVSVHHSLAEQAADYTKKPHVFRLQTADWRVFLFKAASKVEMNSWINRINLVSALHSSPPFPAAVGSQKRFCRPILPASQSAQTLERQLQSYTGMLESFKADLLHQQENAPEGKKAKAKDLEEHRVRTEYLQHEVCRYNMYIQVLEAWKSIDDAGRDELCSSALKQFDKVLCADSAEDKEDEEGGLQRSYSTPSLDLESNPPTVIKVKRNISERRTYRKIVVPRWTKEA